MNLFWKALFGLSAVVALWFGAKLGKQLYPYYSLSKTAPITVHEWGHSQIGRDQYAVRASYTYLVNNQEFGGTHVFTRPIFMNASAIDAQLAKWDALSWQAWYNPAHPEKSSLQHNFPIKTCIQALLALGIFVYFVWLRLYVQRVA